MTSKDIAIKVENLSKCYRIGIKENINDNLTSTILSFLKSPLQNYRKYKSLYEFKDIEGMAENSIMTDTSDIIWALNNVFIEIKKGEVVGIIGGNGAGKSTLLKVLSKITPPTLGTAEIHGRVSSLLEVGTGFHPELTGRDNIYLNGTILGMRKKEIDRKFDEIVDFSGVERFLDTPVKRYSSGMRVRLAFSVAAHLEPEILIVDEVLAVGDAAFQKKCLEKMKNVGREGRTVLFVSHNMSAITRLCRKAYLMDAVCIIDKGPSDKVVSNYLSNGSSSCIGQREWIDPNTAPKSNVVRMYSIKVSNPEGKITAALDIRKPIRIEMEYEVLQDGFSLLPHFTLHNKQGICVFVGLDKGPTWKERPRLKGRFKDTVQIPGNLLSPGIYYVGPAMRTIEPRIFHFWEENAIIFEVIDILINNSANSEYSSETMGIIRPDLEWETEFYPDKEQKEPIIISKAKI
jgi:lipopolysaccharide transport system ATP-binding protein